MKPSEIIRDAMVRVAKGWCKGELMDAEGKVCMGGALIQAMGGVMTNRAGRQAFYSLPEDLNGNWFTVFSTLDRLAQEQGFHDVADYNDGLGIAQPEVLVLMEKAAIMLEECGK